MATQGTMSAGVQHYVGKANEYLAKRNYIIADIDQALAD